VGGREASYDQKEVEKDIRKNSSNPKVQLGLRKIIKEKRLRRKGDWGSMPSDLHD